MAPRIWVMVVRDRVDRTFAANPESAVRTLAKSCGATIVEYAPASELTQAQADLDAARDLLLRLADAAERCVGKGWYFEHEHALAMLIEEARR